MPAWRGRCECSATGSSWPAIRPGLKALALGLSTEEEVVGGLFAVLDGPSNGDVC